QQAMAAGSVDVGLGSGPSLGFRVKGAPAIGVAGMYGAPNNLALLVPINSPLRSPADLKGKRIGVTTTGSLTDWLVRELSRLRGWFKTIAFMRQNKDFTVASEARTLDIRPSVVAKVYDAQMPSFSSDGAWDPKAIEAIRFSLKDLGILPNVPDAKAIYNDTFV